MSETNTNNYKYPKDMPVPKRKWWQRLMALGIIVAILIAGGLTAVYFIKNKPQAKRKPPAKMQTLVTTTQVAPLSTTVSIKALGTMIPSREITLQVQAAGRVEYLHSDFLPGGIIMKDEVIVRIEDTDYRITYQHKKSQLSRASSDLRIEEGNQTVAKQEWELINDISDNLDKSSEDLALRKPQLEKVQANIKVAEAELEQANINLERTTVKAPFNAVIRAKNIDLGSYVTAQSAIGVLTAIDTFWAEVSVPVDKLDWLVLPQKNKVGSKAVVHANGNSSYQGSIIKLLPDLDKEGLMARLLIAVHDPMAINDNKKPLLLGSFIQAEIIGKRLENVFQVPRTSLMDEDFVLTVTAANTLHIQPVSVAWKNADHVFIDKGLAPGDTIVTSNIAAPIEGMELDTNGNGSGGKQPVAERESNAGKQ